VYYRRRTAIGCSLSYLHFLYTRTHPRPIVTSCNVTACVKNLQIESAKRLPPTIPLALPLSIYHNAGKLSTIQYLYMGTIHPSTTLRVHSKTSTSLYSMPLTLPRCIHAKRRLRGSSRGLNGLDGSLTTYIKYIRYIIYRCDDTISRGFYHHMSRDATLNVATPLVAPSCPIITLIPMPMEKIR
jgi:hypothetical protein